MAVACLAGSTQPWRLPMPIETILIIVLVVFLLGGGGFYWSRR
jgi:hypothetical protein